MVAPDSFKGSITAREAADAMELGARQALGPAATIRTVPMADGGEGTLDVLLDAWQGRVVEVEVHDAIGRRRTARLGLSGDGTTAIIEAAEANGLPHVNDVPLRPLQATSLGVGELALAALDEGVEEILLCIGGSASTDGGTGLLQGLGARFLDPAGEPAAPEGGQLHRIHAVDLDGLHPRATEVRWRIAIDVDNPLVGPRGAAATFGPQKGATVEEVALLDDGLDHLASVLAHVCGTSADELRRHRGCGAGGGIPAAALALLRAETVAGVQLVADALGLPEILRDADLVLTGEGQLDEQSLHGKVIDGVRRRTSPSTAVVVIAGSVRLTHAQTADAGILAAHSIVPGVLGKAEVFERAAELVAATAAGVCATFAHGRR